MRDRHSLTPALSACLEAVYRVCRTSQVARSRDLAFELGLHKSTITSTLKSLAGLGLVRYSPYEAITLTAKGETLARGIARKNDVLRRFFATVLDMDEAAAKRAVADVGFVVSAEALEKLAGFLERDEIGTAKAGVAS